jgi:hypothetical protein
VLARLCGGGALAWRLRSLASLIKRTGVKAVERLGEYLFDRNFKGRSAARLLLLDSDELLVASEERKTGMEPYPLCHQCGIVRA